VTEDTALLSRLLALPETTELDVDGARRLEVHAAVLRRKPMLAEVFAECHRVFLELDRRHFGDTPGLRIELGAGVAPVRDTFPEVLATDVVPGDGLDRVLDAQDLDLEDGSVRALYGQNCFHHFPDPARFLAEAERVVAPGGGVLLIEPYHGPVASVLYKRLFASEDFDKDMPGWTTAAEGPMYGANQALSYIVFERDRAELERRFPGLELVATEPLTNYVRYLLSGGLNFRQLVPTASAPLLKGVERLLRPARRALALHHVVVLRRRRP
jgi:SAM-dependent methyltransferase